MLNDLLKNKWIYGALLLMIIILASIWIFTGNEVGEENAEIQVDQQTAASESTDNAGEDTDAGMAENTGGYFFVQEADGAVNVYWCEGNNKDLYQETSIAFSLLSHEDQELIRTGVQLKDEQELANFLENFDS